LSFVRPAAVEPAVAALVVAALVVVALALAVAALVVAPPAVLRVRAGRAVSAIWAVPLAPASPQAQARAVLEQPRAASNGAATGGWDAGRYDGTGTQQERARAYSLRAIYFNRDRYSTAADCLTAAYTRQLPLDLCR
jgi:hypothetical protein